MFVNWICIKHKGLNPPVAFSNNSSKAVPLSVLRLCVGGFICGVFFFFFFFFFFILPIVYSSCR